MTDRGKELIRTVREVYGYVPTDWTHEAVQEGTSSYPAWEDWAGSIQSMPVLKEILERYAEQGQKRLPPLAQVRARYRQATGRQTAAAAQRGCQHCNETPGTVWVVCDGSKVSDPPITADYRLSLESRPHLVAVKCACSGPRSHLHQYATSMVVADEYARQCIEVLRQAITTTEGLNGGGQ